MKKGIGKILCLLGIHKVNEEDWIEMWVSDGYSGEDYDGEKNWCLRCGKCIIRK